MSYNTIYLPICLSIHLSLRSTYLHPHTFQGASLSLPSEGPTTWSSWYCDCRAQRASSKVLDCDRNALLRLRNGHKTLNLLLARGRCKEIIRVQVVLWTEDRSQKTNTHVFTSGV